MSVDQGRCPPRGCLRMSADSDHCDSVPTREVPAERGGRWVRTRGWSMFPALLPGDEVAVGTANSLSTGDLVAFIHTDGSAVIHRLAGRCASSGQLLVGGDGHTVFDKPLPPTAIIGKVQMVRRRLVGVAWEVPALLWDRRRVPHRIARMMKVLVRRHAAVLSRYIRR